MFSEMITLFIILVEVEHVYMSRTSLPAKTENIEITDGEPSKGIEDVWV